MGTWTDPFIEESFQEGVGQAGDGAGGATRQLEPGEGAQIDFERTDGGNEPWLAAIEVSNDPTNYWNTNPRHRTKRMPASQTRCSFHIRGPIYAYRPWCENDDATPADRVGVTTKTRLDGVSI